MTVLVKRFASNDLSELWNELVSRGRIEAIFNRLLSVFLKRLLNQARPATTSRTDPGMPSSHAQSMSFISVFAIGQCYYCAVMEWLGTNEVSLFLSMLILALGSYFIRLRVSQKLHTSNQVVVGGLLGSVFCIFRYKTWNLLLLEAYESSLLLQLYVFLVASAYTLAFAACAVLNWFRHDR
ncbi:hypothetical protein BRARA_I03430 [Brassica rapa]|uniref:Phosphatidic acid phosphatase type 2/haloperoxidase domain-containing protein n=1 Tax=Brassica campestris TaxID=3711 RepID=A0A397Y203_BRACM|nr:hypothetical protein BRARA_I03430 [Brassica rapa]